MVRINTRVEVIIGLLGGGQLARMLALKAHEMGLKVLILSENEDDPAAQVTGNWVRGKLNRREDLEAFMRRCTLVTFESEFLDAGLLADLSRETKVDVRPDPRLISKIQDRLTQKQLLTEYGLPTATYRDFTATEELDEVGRGLGRDFVIKQRRFGYDGYGTYVIRGEKDLKAFRDSFDSIRGREFGFIAESFIPFRRELAVMVARSRSGDVVAFPFVETFQQNSRCLWVKGPLAPSPRLEDLGRRMKEFLTGIDYVGILGVELFETHEGELVINELAPRVHNSAHYSLDALLEDQFSTHLKAISGLKIAPPVQLAPDFAMYNLLGTSNEAPRWSLPPDVKLHWYGKKDNRPGRKMGHVNALGSHGDAEQTLARLTERVRDNFQL